MPVSTQADQFLSHFLTKNDALAVAEKINAAAQVPRTKRRSYVAQDKRQSAVSITPFPF